MFESAWFPTTLVDDALALAESHWQERVGSPLLEKREVELGVFVGLAGEEFVVFVVGQQVVDWNNKQLLNVCYLVGVKLSSFLLVFFGRLLPLFVNFMSSFLIFLTLFDAFFCLFLSRLCFVLVASFFFVALVTFRHFPPFFCFISSVLLSPFYCLFGALFFESFGIFFCTFGHSLFWPFFVCVFFFFIFFVQPFQCSLF